MPPVRLAAEDGQRSQGERPGHTWRGPAYGNEPEAERLPFAYAAYDPRDNVVIIAVGGNTPRYPVVLRHLIWHPTEVELDATSRGTERRGKKREGPPLYRASVDDGDSPNAAR
jgi:hypothetical protein